MVPRVGRWPLSVVVYFSLLLSPVAVGADDADVEGTDRTPASADAVIQQASDALLVLIEESHAYVKEDPERFYTAVEAVLGPVVDFKGFARSVMAAHYKSAEPAQRVRFAETFPWGLVRSYALLLTEFSDGEIMIDPPGKKRNSRYPRIKLAE